MGRVDHLLQAEAPRLLEEGDRCAVVAHARDLHARRARTWPDEVRPAGLAIAIAQHLAVHLDGVLGQARHRLRQHLEHRLHLGGRTACGPTRRRRLATQGRHPRPHPTDELGAQAHAHVGPGARCDAVAALEHQGAQRLLDELAHRAFGAEHLGHLGRAGLDARVAVEGVLAGQGALIGLEHLGHPHAVELGLGGLDDHAIGLHQRAHQDRTQGLARRLVQAVEQLLVHQLERLGQLTAALQRLHHELARSRARIALGLHLVEARADLGQRAQVMADQRLLPFARHHQAVEAGELLPDRAHGNLGILAQREVQVHRRGAGRHAEDALLEPLHEALLPLGQTLVDQRGVVPGGLLVESVQQHAHRRVARVTQAVHVHHGLIEAGEVVHGDALHELLPLAHVLGLVERGERLLDLLRADLEREVIGGRGLEHPVAGLQLLVRRVLDRLLDVLLPGLTREGARDGMAAGHDLAVVLGDKARDGDRGEAGGGTRLDLAVHTLARGHALDDAAQVLARLVQQREVELLLREGRIAHLRQGEGHDALGALDQLLTRHGAAVGLQPAAPEASELVAHVTGFQAAAVAQHQVGLERVVGLGDVGAGGLGVGGARRCRGRCGRRGRVGRSLGADQHDAGRGARRWLRGGGVGGGHHGWFAGALQGAQLRRAAVHLGEVARDRLGDRLEHHGLQAMEVLFLQARLDRVALVQAQANRPGALGTVTLHLLQAVLQDLQCLQARLQVDALVLHLLGLEQIGLHVRHQLAVAHVGPGPACQHGAHQGQPAEEGRVAQAQLVAAGVLLDQVTVGKDDAREQLLEEEAALRIDRRRRPRLELQPELIGHALAGAAGGLPFLHGAREVEAAEDGAELIRVVLEQCVEEGSQGGLERSELQRERQHTWGQLLAPVQRHARHRGILEALIEQIELLLELRDDVASASGVVRQGGAPDLVTFAALAVFEKIHEPRDQIGLGEHDIDRRKDLQLFGELLDTLAQLARQVNRELGLVGAQLRHADGNDDAIERGLGTVLLEQRQKAQPLAPVLFVHRVAPGRVQQNAFGGEVPVAMAGAANALDDVVGVVGKGELQARLDHGRALAGSRVADDSVPGQLVQRGRARGLAQARGLDELDGFGHALAHGGDLVLAAGIGGFAHGLVGLVGHGLLERLRRALGAPAPHTPDAQPGQPDQPQHDPGPDQPDLQGVGAQQQHARQRGHADDGQGAGIKEKTPDSLHGDFQVVHAASRTAGWGGIGDRATTTRSWGD